MRTAFKSFLAITLCMIFVFTSILSVGAIIGDEVASAKKIISVVYDDSGSMFGDAWGYANYAMQALTSLLNEKDELYITYMSDPGVSVSKNLADIGQAVTEIRDWNNSGETPGKSLYTAKEKLDTLSESDPTTQFWMVVMTDGDIKGLKSNLQNTMDSFKGSTMSNGTALNVVYMPMGDSAVTINEDRGKGLYQFEAETDAAIFTSMFEIATLISGRLPADNVKVNGKEVTFSSKLPLYNISVFIQESDAEVKKASSKDGDLSDIRRIDVFTKSNDYSTKVLKGNATVVSDSSSGAQNVIPAGEFTIEFSKNVKKENLLIQYEPAIGLDTSIKREGIEITDPSDLRAGNKVDITINPVIPGTTTVIPASDLPKGTTWSIEYLVNDKVVDSTSGNSLNGVEIQLGDSKIRTTMTIPGYAPLIYEFAFSIDKVVYNLGIDTEQPDPLTYRRNMLGTGSIEGDQVTFYITNEGQRLSKEELKEIGAKLRVSGASNDNSNENFWMKGLAKAGLYLKANDDGSYSLIPKKGIWPAFMILSGSYTVEVEITMDSSVTAQGTFYIKPSWADWFDLLTLVIILAVVVYIISIFAKPRFHGEALYKEILKTRERGRGGISEFRKRVGQLKWYYGIFNPFRRSGYYKYGQFEFVADKNKRIYVTDTSIVKSSIYSIGASDFSPETNLTAVVRSLTVVEKEQGKRRASRQSLHTTNETNRIYWKTSKEDNHVYSIWIIRNRRR